MIWELREVCERDGDVSVSDFDLLRDELDDGALFCEGHFLPGVIQDFRFVDIGIPSLLTPQGCRQGLHTFSHELFKHVQKPVQSDFLSAGLPRMKVAPP